VPPWRQKSRRFGKLFNPNNPHASAQASRPGLRHSHASFQAEDSTLERPDTNRTRTCISGPTYNSSSCLFAFLPVVKHQNNRIKMRWRTRHSASPRLHWMNRVIGISGESTKVDNKSTLKSIKATSLRAVAFISFFFLYQLPEAEASSTKTTYQRDSQFDLDLKLGQTQALLIFYNLHSKRGNKMSPRDKYVSYMAGFLRKNGIIVLQPTQTQKSILVIHPAKRILPTRIFCVLKIHQSLYIYKILHTPSDYLTQTLQFQEHPTPRTPNQPTKALILTHN
jgi:hypothetical protein